MASPEDELEIISTSICGFSEFDDGEQLTSYLKQIRDLEKPPSFSNMMSDIRTDELFESEVLIGESGPVSPDDLDSNKIEVNIGGDEDDEELHLHLYSDGGNLDTLGSLFSESIDITGGTTIHITGVDMAFPTAFEDLELPIENNSQEYGLNGARFSKDNKTYLVQDTESDSETYLRYSNREWFDVGSGEADSLIQNLTTEAHAFIEEIEP